MSTGEVRMRGMRWLVLFAVIVTHVVSAEQANEVSRVEQWDFKVDPGTRLAIGNISGDIMVNSVPGDVMRVKAVFRASSAGDLARTTVEVKKKKHRINLKRKDADAGWFGRNMADSRIDFVVHAPPFVALDGIKTTGGQVAVSGNRNRVRVKAGGGRVVIRQAAGSVTVKSVDGDVMISLGQLTGGQRITVRSVNGDVRVDWPENASARVHADTVNGSVSGGRLPARISRGLIRKQFDATIGGGKAVVNVSTVNGHVTLDNR